MVDRDLQRSQCPPMDRERKLVFQPGDPVAHKIDRTLGNVVKSIWADVDSIECERIQVDWDDGLMHRWYFVDDLDRIPGEKELCMAGVPVKAIAKKLTAKWTIEKLNPVDFNLSDEAVEGIIAEAKCELAKVRATQPPVLIKHELISVQPMKAPTGIAHLLNFGYEPAVEPGGRARELGYQDGTVIPKRKRPTMYRRKITADDGTRGEC